MKKAIQKILNKRGLQIIRYPSGDEERRMFLMKHFKINKVFDIGANVGQYSLKIRDLGFEGNIISFEPLKDAFKILEQKASNDPIWETYNYALGNEDGETMINVSENSYSSSILEILPTHVESAPESKYIKTETIKIAKLDSIFDEFHKEEDQILFKIDTQGFEKNVLDGAAKSLTKTKGIQLEMSIVPLYKNEMLFDEMIVFLKSKGFYLYSMESAFVDPLSGQLLQIDGLFFRN